MSHLNRRRFLADASIGLGATFAIGGTKSSGRVIGANDAVRLAVAGLNGRGGDHVAEFGRLKNVEIATLVDPDARTYPKRLDQLRALGRTTAPKTIKDVRQALDDPDIDAVSIATPNHWHALITIWACQAGKDVYVEKPCSHNIHEGRVAVTAARKYARVVQHGTQGRSLDQWANLLAVTKSGRYGKLLASRALCYKTRNSIGMKPDAVPPAPLDYDLWTGPAPTHPFNPNYVHYNWHWFWDFGNGDIGNQGVHQMDVARWMIPGATLPKSAFSLGGRFGDTDQGQTPNTQLALLDYGDAHLIFEVRGLKSAPYLGESVGNILHYEHGDVAPVKGKGLRFFAKGASSSDEGEPVPKLDHPARGQNHFANFIQAVRDRKPDALNADILEAHYSSAACHLANISYRLGQPADFNPRTNAFDHDRLAYETLTRMESHLAVENHLKLDALPYHLGRRLTFDSKTETFSQDPEADALLTRPYRKPYVLPDLLA